MHTQHPTIILQHGLGGPARWFGWLQKKCAGQGCTMRAPLMPSPSRPERAEWLEQMCSWYGDISGAVIIGHSLGCLALVHYLGSCAQDQKADAVILVAPPAYFTGKEHTEQFYDAEPNWEEAKKHAKHFVVIRSDDDPLVPGGHAEEYVEKLGAEFIDVSGEGHFLGSENELVWKHIERFI